MKSDLQDNPVSQLGCILEKELSYKIYGIFLKVGKDLGNICKEIVYQKACEKELQLEKIKYLSKPKLNIATNRGMVIGYFEPDLLIENKIIVEIKAIKALGETHISQLLKYLEKSRYEVGYLVNFGTSYIQIIRRIFTNDRKQNH